MSLATTGLALTGVTCGPIPHLFSVTMHLAYPYDRLEMDWVILSGLPALLGKDGVHLFDLSGRLSLDEAEKAPPQGCSRRGGKRSLAQEGARAR